MSAPLCCFKHTKYQSDCTLCVGLNDERDAKVAAQPDKGAAKPAPNTDELDEAPKIIEGLLNGYHISGGGIVLTADGVEVYRLTKEEAVAKLAAREQRLVAEALLKLKEEMRQHTVPEGRGLITRSYLENSIDFMIAGIEANRPEGVS